MADETTYTIVPIPVVFDRMREWGHASIQLGRGDWFIRAMRYIDERLRSNPTTWGDPLYDYRQARLRVYQANHENFIVTYAVHLDRPIVFFRNIELLAGSPLFGQ